MNDSIVFVPCMTQEDKDTQDAENAAYMAAIDEMRRRKQSEAENER